MNLQHILVLARYDVSKAFVSARGVLFLALYGILWFWILYSLAGGSANWLAGPEGNAVVSWLLDPSLARHLFLDNPPTLSVAFLLGMSLLPIFVLWGAGDQTASDIDNQYLRFIIPRCGRGEIYVGRFLGAVFFITMVHLLVVAAAVLVSAYADPDSFAAVAGFGIRVAWAVLIYGLPYIAMMSLFGAMTGSAPIAVLVAISAYAIIAIAGGLLSMNWPEAAAIRYLTPSPLKGPLLVGESGIFTTLGMLGYTAVYFAIGWRIFSRRDI